jgi:hypothetical protein
MQIEGGILNILTAVVAAKKAKPLPVIGRGPSAPPAQMWSGVRDAQYPWRSTVGFWHPAMVMTSYGSASIYREAANFIQWKAFRPGEKYLIETS